MKGVAYKNLSVDGLRRLADKISHDAEGKKEELRLYVGRRYRDLLRSADGILEMKTQSQKAFEAIGKMTKTLNSLHDRRKKKELGEGEYKNYGIGGLQCYDKTDLDLRKAVNLISQSPEQIWDLMDSCLYTEACKAYFHTKSVYIGVMENAEEWILKSEAAVGYQTQNDSKRLLNDDCDDYNNGADDDVMLSRRSVTARAPQDDESAATRTKNKILFCMQNWECLKSFPGQIRERCIEDLMKTSLLPRKNVYDILCAVALLSGEKKGAPLMPLEGLENNKGEEKNKTFVVPVAATGSDLLRVYLDTKYALLKLQFESGFSEDCEVEMVEHLLTETIQTVTTTIHLAASLFIPNATNYTSATTTSSSSNGGNDRDQNCRRGNVDSKMTGNKATMVVTPFFFHLATTRSLSSSSMTSSRASMVTMTTTSIGEEVSFGSIDFPVLSVVQEACRKWLESVRELYANSLPRIIQRVRKGEHLSRLNDKILSVLENSYPFNCSRGGGEQHQPSVREDGTKGSFMTFDTWQEAMCVLFPIAPQATAAKDSKTAASTSPSTESSSTSWKGAISTVEGNEVAILWNLLIADTFCGRSQAIVASSFASIEIDTVLKKAIGLIFSSPSEGEEGGAHHADKARDNKSPGSSRSSLLHHSSHRTTTSSIILWREISDAVKRIYTAFNRQSMAVLFDLMQLIMMTTTTRTMLNNTSNNSATTTTITSTPGTTSRNKILSLSKLLQFVLKPKIQSGCSECMSRLVKTMRRYLRELETNILDMDEEAYALSADKALFLSHLSKALAGYKDKIIHLEHKKHQQYLVETEEAASSGSPSHHKYSRNSNNNSNSSSNNSSKSSTRSTSNSTYSSNGGNFVIDTLSAVGDGVSQSLLRLALSGFRVWARFVATTVLTDQMLEPKLKRFIQDNQFNVHLPMTWKRVQGGGRESGDVIIPYSPSPYVMDTLMRLCSEIYRVSGSQVDDGFLACTKIHMAGSLSQLILQTLLPSKQSKQREAGEGEEEEKEEERTQLTHDAWKQMFFDLHFLHAVLHVPGEDGVDGHQLDKQISSSRSSSSLFSAQFVLVNGSEEVQASKKYRRELIQFVASKIDPIELEYLQGMFMEQVTESIKTTHMLLGALSPVIKHDDSARKQVSSTAGKKTSVVRTVALANPIDHIPLLATSLYPKKKNQSITYRPTVAFLSKSRSYKSKTTSKATIERPTGGRSPLKTSRQQRQKQPGLLDMVMGRIGAPR